MQRHEVRPVRAQMSALVQQATGIDPALLGRIVERALLAVDGEATLDVEGAVVVIERLRAGAMHAHIVQLDGYEQRAGTPVLTWSVRRLAAGLYEIDELRWAGDAPAWTAWSEADVQALAARSGILGEDGLRALLEAAMLRVPAADRTVKLPGRVAVVTRIGDTVLIDVLVRDHRVAGLATVRFRRLPGGGVADPAWDREPPACAGG